MKFIKKHIKAISVIIFLLIIIGISPSETITLQPIAGWEDDFGPQNLDDLFGADENTMLIIVDKNLDCIFAYGENNTDEGTIGFNYNDKRLEFVDIENEQDGKIEVRIKGWFTNTTDFSKTNESITSVRVYYPSDKVKFLSAVKSI